nr:haloalkane dehalogenase [Amylibacter sp.]
MKDAYTSPHPQSRLTAAGVDIAYVDTGPADGHPLVFMHGNPTSSYLWRDIIAGLKDQYRCIAPDLPGMGNSGPMASGNYRFVDHVQVMDAWFDALPVQGPFVLVCHDWGSALAFHWASRNRDKIAGIAYMEAIVCPRDWSDFPEGRDKIFRMLRGAEGENLVLEQNFFIETVLPKSIQRDMSDDEMAVYRAPFPTPETRLPTLVWPQELPIEGQPADVVAIVKAYGAWLAQSEVPKLFVNAEPGATLIGRGREFCRSWPNQREVTVSGVHFVQEDSSALITSALKDFLKTV